MMTFYKNIDFKIKFNNNVQKSIISFDTECSTVFSSDNVNWFAFDKNKENGFYNDVVKCSFMYIFAFCIDDVCIYGRTGDDLVDCLQRISDAAKGKETIIYVHNLNYDFQTIRSFIKIDDVFAKDKRNILYCKSKKYNIIFKCSYNLSGMKLADIPEIYHTETKKLVGDLDYNVIRTYKTEMTDKEMAYVENDVRIVYEYIKKEVELAGSLKKIALTKTGKVRKLFKQKLKEVYGNFYFKDWTSYINSMNDTNIETFMALNEASAGGYVHANMNHINEIIYGNSYDKRSFYPSIMISEKFPSSLFEKTEDLDFNFNDYCYLYHLHFYNVKSKCEMTMLSSSQCEWCDFDTKLDNGRILSSSFIDVYMTDIDFFNFLRCYDCDDNYEIVEMWKSKKDYLPKILIEFIIDCYKKKDFWKKERAKYEEKSKEWKICDINLSIAKRNLNSIFGMTMTKTIKKVEDVWEDGDFKTIENDVNEFQNKLFMQDGKSYFSFAWGVWVMSYARKIIFDAIIENDSKTAYSDTDCIKSIGDLDLKKFDDIYDEKLNEMANHYNIDVSDIIGIGHFVNETKNGMKFKTLGQKKYICEIDGIMKCVASGVAPDSIKQEIGHDFNKFQDDMVFGYDAGCVNVVYNDNQNDIIINGETIKQKYGVCIYPCKFKMKKSIIQNLEVL